jgi:membrane protease YdiL (CAAX protease family)
MSERTVIAPIVFFLALYFGGLTLFLSLPLSFAQDDVRSFHLPGLAAVLLATAGTAFLFRDRDPRSVARRPAERMRDLPSGALIAVAVIGVAQLIIAATPNLSMHRGNGFPLALWFTLIVPGVLHEELLMRGSVFDRLSRFSRSFALLATTTLFALLHLHNSGISAIAFTNLLLGGAMLGLSRLDSGSVVQPIAIHLTWNTLIGPLFGDEVSGFRFPQAFLREIDRGPEALTGGSFGIEGSAVLTGVLTIVVVAWSIRLVRNARREEGVVEDAMI